MIDACEGGDRGSGGSDTSRRDLAGPRTRPPRSRASPIPAPRASRAAARRVRSSVARASATSGSAPCLAASKPATLTFTNRTPGSWKADFDAVVKSLQRVPIPITRSASRAMRLAAAVPVAPTAPRLSWWSETSAPTPGLGLAHRNPRGVDELAQRGGRLAVDDAPARDDQRAVRRADQLLARAPSTRAPAAGGRSSTRAAPGTRPGRRTPRSGRPRATRA